MFSHPGRCYIFALSCRIRSETFAIHCLMTFSEHPYFFSHKQGINPPVPVTSALCFKQVFDPFFQLFILVACKKALALVKEATAVHCHVFEQVFQRMVLSQRTDQNGLFPIGQLFLTNTRAFFKISATPFDTSRSSCSLFTCFLKDSIFKMLRDEFFFAARGVFVFYCRHNVSGPPCRGSRGFPYR